MRLNELMEAGGDHLRRKGVARIAAGEHHHGNKTAMRKDSARDSEQDKERTEHDEYTSI